MYSRSPERLFFRRYNDGFIPVEVAVLGALAVHKAPSVLVRGSGPNRGTLLLSSPHESRVHQAQHHDQLG
jgi:hypothetical protein